MKKEGVKKKKNNLLLVKDKQDWFDPIGHYSRFSQLIFISSKIQESLKTQTKTDVKQRFGHNIKICNGKTMAASKSE